LPVLSALLFAVLEVPMIPFESCSFSARKEGRAIMGASHDMSATTAAAPAASAAGTPAKAPGSPLKTLGFFGFFAITASMVMTVYAYPNFASSGMHLIFFLVLGGVFSGSFPSRCARPRWQL